MILYHGSNMVFKTPLLAKCSPYKDFGQGFYLSDSFDVARQLGEVLRRMQFRRKLTTQYSFHTHAALSLLVFKEARYV